LTRSKIEEYEWSPFKTAAWGSILTIAGVLGLFASAGISPLVLLSIFIVFFGLLVIVAGLLR